MAACGLSLAAGSRAGAALWPGVWASRCGGTCCGAQAPGHAGSSSPGPRDGCPVVGGISPDRGQSPGPLHWQADP